MPVRCRSQSARKRGTARHDRGDQCNGRPVLSVDLPSGVNGTTGAVMASRSRATETVHVLRRKPGAFAVAGAAFIAVAYALPIYRDRRGGARGNSSTNFRKHSAVLPQVRFLCRRSTPINTPRPCHRRLRGDRCDRRRRGCRRAARLRAALGLVTLASPGCARRQRLALTPSWFAPSIRRSSLPNC